MSEQLSEAQLTWRGRRAESAAAFTERTISISTAAASGYEVLIKINTNAMGASFSGEERSPASDAASVQMLFEQEAIKLLLGGFDVGLAVDPDDKRRRTDLALSQTSLPEWRPQSQLAADYPKHRLRALPPASRRMWLQLTADGALSLISVGTAVAPKTLVSQKAWRLFETLSEWIATRRGKYLVHLLLEVLLTTSEDASPIHWVDLLAYDGEDVRGQTASYRLALAEQAMSEIGPSLKLLMRPLENDSRPGQTILATPTHARYGQPLLLLQSS